MKKSITPKIASSVTALLAIGVWVSATSAYGNTPMATPLNQEVAIENVHSHHSLNNQALDILGNNCDNSQLDAHNGFQEAPRCVSTAFGEVPAQQDGAQLLIVRAPETLKVGEPFELKVSTRNLVRDRFLAAGQGGYYLESSFLDPNGLVRGHFHTACRNLGDGKLAPQPDRNSIFIATEDGGGGAAPDVVTVRFANGLPSKGKFQCASWAGDGSHRIPMMQFANQIPAFDTVDIQVGGGGK